MNSISRILTKFFEAFGLGGRQVYIELDNNFIKLAEVASSKGKRRIERLMTVPITGEDDASISADIKKMFSALGLTGRTVRLNIPRHLVTVRFLSLPSTDDVEIAKIIKLEALKHIPHTGEDVVSGYRIVEKGADGYSSILLVIALSRIIERASAILKDASLETEKICLGSESLYLWYMVARENKEEEDNVLLANIDSDHLSLDIIEGDKLVFTRGVMYEKGQKITAEKIIEQIRVSTATYVKESEKRIGKVVVTGASSKIVECRDPLTRELKVPVEIIDQIQNINISDELPPDTFVDSSFVELMGFALRFEDARINLVPEKAEADIRLVQSRNSIITALALSGVIVGLLLGIAFKKIYDRSSYMSIIRSEMKRIEPKVAKAKKMLSDIEIVKAEAVKGPLAIEVLSEIYDLVPAEISLNMLDYESGKGLTIRGTAPSLGDVFKFVTVVEGSPYFEAAKVRYANKRLSGGRETADFEITCGFAKYEKARK